MIADHIRQPRIDGYRKGMELALLQYPNIPKETTKALIDKAVEQYEQREQRRAQQEYWHEILEAWMHQYCDFVLAELMETYGFAEADAREALVVYELKHRLLTSISASPLLRDIGETAGKVVNTYKKQE